MNARRVFLALTGLSALAGPRVLAEEGKVAAGSVDEAIRLASFPPAVFDLVEQMDALWGILTIDKPRRKTSGVLRKVH